MKKFLVLFISIVFIYSCNNSHEVVPSTENTGKATTGSTIINSNAKTYNLDKQYLAEKLSKSKFLKLHYQLSVLDNESNKIKKGFKITQSYIEKLEKANSNEKNLSLLSEMYENPSKKLKQIDTMYNLFADLGVEIPELKLLSEKDFKEVMQIAISKFLETSSSNVLNPDDCKKNCDAAMNSTINSAWRQFLYTSGGCAALSPTIGGFFVCLTVAAAVYDDSWADAHNQNFICKLNCGN